MIKCPFCGATYPDSSKKCPYCHSENRREADRRYKEKLKAFDREEQRIRGLPQIFVKKSAKKLALAGGAAVLACIAASMIMFAAGRGESDSVYQAMQNHLETLEAYYGQGAYGDIHEYMKAHELYGSSYAKYQETGEAAALQSLTEEGILELRSAVGAEYRDILVHVLSDASKGLRHCRKGMDRCWNNCMARSVSP